MDNLKAIPGDRSYEEAIDRLIPTAIAQAVRRVEEIGTPYKDIIGVDGKPERHYYITQFFHEAMNQLAYETGLRPML